MIALRRIYYENAVYHVLSRGNNKRNILAKKEDKRAFLEAALKYKKRFIFKIYGYCLMDNHFHMLLEVQAKHNISKVMQSLLLSYSTTYRNKYGYVGHLWQGRFISRNVESERYALECLEYMHNNPVRAKIVNSAIDYEWSSARFYFEGKDQRDGVLDRYR